MHIVSINGRIDTRKYKSMSKLIGEKSNELLPKVQMHTIRLIGPHCFITDTYSMNVKLYDKKQVAMM